VFNLCGPHLYDIYVILITFLYLLLIIKKSKRRFFFLSVTICLGERIPFAREGVVTNYRQKKHRARSTDNSRQSNVPRVLIHVPY